jgi:uncharacterized membrane protein YkvA (DUF1232 family)
MTKTMEEIKQGKKTHFLDFLNGRNKAGKKNPFSRLSFYIYSCSLSEVLLYFKKERKLTRVKKTVYVEALTNYIVSPLHL